jgi:hypothetical protein
MMPINKMAKAAFSPSVKLSSPLTQTKSAGLFTRALPTLEIAHYFVEFVPRDPSQLLGDPVGPPFLVSLCMSEFMGRDKFQNPDGFSRLPFEQMLKILIEEYH